MGGRRVLVALGILLVLSVAATAGMNNPITDAGYLDLADTKCFECHAADQVPLREMVSIEPDPGASAAIGDEFDYTVRFRNPWLAELIRFEPSLDISDAPSLVFVEGLPGILQQYEGVIPFDAAALPTSSRTASVAIEVEAGVTDLEVVLAPANTDPALGPQMAMNVYATKDEPSGRPDRTTVAPGPGRPARVHIQDGAELAELGFGTWSIEAEATAASGSTLHPGAVGDVPFTVWMHKHYNTSEERVQNLGRELGIGGGIVTDRSTSFTWRLQATDAPAPGEEVRIGLNLVSYWDHGNSATVDFGYTRHGLAVPVLASTGQVTFDAGPAPGPVPAVGVSMYRISEVVGYASAFLVLASLYVGGMFGKASRRQLNQVFGYAKRRVAFHNALSYAVIAAAGVHMAIFLLPGLEGRFHWTLGLIWGLPAMLAMLGLGLTGALQVSMIRKWSYATWRWTHFGLTVGVIVFTAVHIFLDGANWGDFQSGLGWQNPFDPRL